MVWQKFHVWLDSQQRPGLALKLFVTAGHVAKLGKNAAAEFPAGKSKIVRHASCGNTELFSQSGIGGPGIFIAEVIALEHGELRGLPRRLALCAQPLNGHGKQSPYPLFFKIIFCRAGLRGSGEFMLGFFKVQRDVGRGVTALLAMSIAYLIHKLAIDAGTQKSAELPLRGIVRGEKVFLQQAGEKILGEVLSVFAFYMPA